MYVTPSEYSNLGYDSIESDSLPKFLRDASHHVDTLTFNRIGGDIDSLTDFQKTIVKHVVCEQAEFLFENQDAISTVLNSYSINGVSMQFGDGLNVSWEGGLPMRRTTYALLSQTGLCCRLAR